MTVSFVPIFYIFAMRQDPTGFAATHFQELMIQNSMIGDHVNPANTSHMFKELIA